MKELIINERIRDREVRLIGEDGTQYGIIPISEARRIAEEKGLDICKVSPPDVTPATCKLMDYGKYRYDQQKREKEQRKNQRIVELKEVRLSATIDVGDTKRLAAQTAKFISEGNKVKASIRLKGRQQAHPEIAVGIIKDYIEMVGEGAVVEKAPVQEGRMIYTILAPQNKKIVKFTRGTPFRGRQNNQTGGSYAKAENPQRSKKAFQKERERSL